jgi:hypothetical protein
MTLLLHILFLSIPNRDSSVGIETGYGLEGSGLIPGRGTNFLLFHSVQTGSGAHPASYSMGTGGVIYSEVKWPGCKLTTHLYLMPRSTMVEL